MEFREKPEEVSGGFTILVVLAISSMAWYSFPSFLSHSYCNSQNLEATQSAGISR